MNSTKRNKKLGVWGKDKIVRDDGKSYAKDYYCVRCYREEKLVQAEVFWPCMDLDIRDNPYCNPCVTELDLEVLLKLSEMDNE